LLHLIHPAAVHFAVALVVLGGLSEAVGLIWGRPALLRFGNPLTVLAVPAVGVAVVSGFLAANSVTVTAEAHAVLERHESLGLAALGVLLAALLWKAWFRGQLPRSHSAPYALLLLVAVVLVVLGATLGGELVYTHGVGVAGR